MIFNGIDMAPYFSINEIKGRGLAGTEVTTVAVPGMDGSRYTQHKRPEREITVKVTIVTEGLTSLRTQIDEINRIFNVAEPVPITFEDEPGYTYYGRPAGTSEGDEFTYFHKGEITFICPDPYKYGPEKTEQFNTDVALIDNGGVEEAMPTIDLEVKSEVTTLSTYLMIQNQRDDWLLVGNPEDVETGSYVKYERVFFTEANTLTGWTEANTGEVDGVITGEMEAISEHFQVADYGTGNGWHGPAVKQSLSETLQDFRMSTWVTLDNSIQSAVGRVEIYLLDVNGNPITKLAMKDVRAGRSLAVGEVMARNPSDEHFIVNEYGDHPGNWNDFAGIMRVEREGDMWSAFIGMGNSKNGYHTRRFAYWRDTRGEYTTPVAQVVVHIGKYGSNRACSAGVYSISVDKINQREIGTPVILQSGDFVKIDHKNGTVWLNGEPRTDLVAFGSDYFGLAPGDNQLILSPPDSFIGSVTYREPY